MPRKEAQKQTTRPQKIWMQVPTDKDAQWLRECLQQQGPPASRYIVRLWRDHILIYVPRTAEGIVDHPPPWLM